MKTFITKHFDKIVLIKLIAIGFILRIWISSSKLSNVDENTALSFLIGRDISRGRVLAYRYEHFFGGTLEYLVASPIIALIKSVTLSQMLISLVFLIGTSCIYYFGFQRTQYRKTMRYVLACLWIWPGFFLISNTKFSGIFAVIMLLQVAILASAYYAAHSLINRKYFLIFAFLCGLSVWVFPISIFTCITSYIWIIKSSPGLKPQRLRAFAIFALGSSFLIALTISEKGANLLRFYDKSIHTDIDKPNALINLSDIFSMTVSNEHKLVFYQTPLMLSIIFSLCTIALIAFLIKGAIGAAKTKISDFAFLMLIISACQIVLLIILYVFSINVPSIFLITLVAPVVFLIFNSSTNKIVISSIIFCMFVSSCIYLYSTSKNFNNYVSDNKGRATFLIEQVAAQRILSNHQLAYPLTLSNDEKVLVSPFDANYFDSKIRSQTSTRTDAVLIDTNIKNERNTMLCIQSYFQQGFVSKSSSNLKIYLVPKKFKSKVSSIAEECSKVTT